jgi:hypothetical protein
MLAPPVCLLLKRRSLTPEARTELVRELDAVDRVVTSVYEYLIYFAIAAITGLAACAGRARVCEHERDREGHPAQGRRSRARRPAPAAGLAPGELLRYGSYRIIVALRIAPFSEQENRWISISRRRNRRLPTKSRSGFRTTTTRS